MATFNSPTLTMNDPNYTVNGEALVVPSWSHSHALSEFNRKSGLTIVTRYGVMSVLDRRGLLGE